MQLCGSKFTFICTIKPELEVDGTIQKKFPQQRYKNAASSTLHNYGAGPFCKFTIPNNIRISGVYALFLGVENAPSYVGECKNLSQRFNAGYGNISPRNCFIGGQQTNCRINNRIYESITDSHEIALWFFETNEYKSVEKYILRAVNPNWNLR